jgi:hypothetical protein
MRLRAVGIPVPLSRGGRQKHDLFAPLSSSQAGTREHTSVIPLIRSGSRSALSPFGIEEEMRLESQKKVAIAELLSFWDAKYRIEPVLPFCECASLEGICKYLNLHR